MFKININSKNSIATRGRVAPKSNNQPFSSAARAIKI